MERKLYDLVMKLPEIISTRMHLLAPIGVFSVVIQKDKTSKI